MFLNYISTSDGKFLDGKNEFRFIGCNMYELANAGIPAAGKMLLSAKDQGFDVIRFWAFAGTDINNLRYVFDTASELDLRLIPVLADNWGYLQNDVIDDSWYLHGYKKLYLKHVTDLTAEFSDRKEILLWELINEPAAGEFNIIKDFADNVSSCIKENNSDHLISIGTIGGVGDKFGNEFSRFNSSYFGKLFSLPVLDAVSIHDYSFNSTIAERLDIRKRFQGQFNGSAFLKTLDRIINFFPEMLDRFTIDQFNRTFDMPLTLRSIWQKYIYRNIQTAESLKKPVYIGEIGFKKNMGKYRKIILEKELRKYFKAGVSGILLWSFESEGRSKDGHDYGFDEKDDFREVIRKFNRAGSGLSADR